MGIEHWMTFSTFAEQKFFNYPNPTTYDGVIINANMVCHAPSGIAAFLTEKTQISKFIIDPMTHAFQHPPKFIKKSDGNVKSSISKLAQAYGDPFLEHAGKRSIHFNDFQDKTRKHMTRECINFQRNKLNQFRQNHDIDKYLSSDKESNQIKPYAIVSPYFYLDDLYYKEWSNLMVKCLDDTLSLKTPDEKVFVSIVMSKNILNDSDKIKEIVSQFNRTEISGFLVWIDNFNEEKEGIQSLKNYLYLFEQLRNQKEQKKEVINLHGGYLSILAAGKLGKHLLSGVAHGPEFGEYRAVIPVGGGIPVSKYYVPKLHSRVKYRDASRIFLNLNWLKDCDTFYQEICSCAICKKIIHTNPEEDFIVFGESNPFLAKRKTKNKTISVSREMPTKEAKELCLTHYLENKKIEYENATNKDKDLLLNELKSNKEIFEKQEGVEFVSYLERWYQVLSKLNLQK